MTMTVENETRGVKAITAGFVGFLDADLDQLAAELGLTSRRVARTPRQSGPAPTAD